MVQDLGVPVEDEGVDLVVPQLVDQVEQDARPTGQDVLDVGEGDVVTDRHARAEDEVRRWGSSRRAASTCP